jgi:hypothetical protein
MQTTLLILLLILACIILFWAFGGEWAGYDMEDEETRSFFDEIDRRKKG